MKHIFNTFGRKAPAAVLTVAALVAPASASTQDLSSLMQGETYWKTNVVDAVIALRPCPESTVCGRIVWFNPADENLHTYFGIAGQRARTPEELRTTFCNFSPRMSLTQTSPSTGEGTLHSRGMRMTLNLQARVVSDQRIDVRISKAIVSKRDSWTRISADDARYPHCTPAAPRPGA